MSSLTIDTNLMYLQSRLNFSIDKLEVYQGKSTEEILKAEAACGNPLAVELANEILSNIAVLIEIFQLTDVRSKYIILINMLDSKKRSKDENFVNMLLEIGNRLNINTEFYKLKLAVAK